MGKYRPWQCCLMMGTPAGSASALPARSVLWEGPGMKGVAGQQQNKARHPEEMREEE